MAKSYITIKTTEINTVDFSEVIESYPPPRYSLDGTEFIVKWAEGSPHMPDSIAAVPEVSRSAILTHAQARTLMATSSWTDPNDIP